MSEKQPMKLREVVRELRALGWKKVTLGGGILLVTIGSCSSLMSEVDESPSNVSSTRVVESSPSPRPAAPSKPAPPPREEPSPSEPTEKQLKLDADYHAEWVKDPSRDIDAIVAKKHGLTREQLAEEQMEVALYRDWLQKRAQSTINSGVVGSVEVQGLDRSELGAHTLKFALTVTRCPEGSAARDKQVEFLATTALKQIVQNLPSEIDAYEASLRYRGLGCGEGAVGYGGRWSRAGGSLVLE